MTMGTAVALALLGITVSAVGEASASEALAAADSIRVEGAANCPSAAQVKRVLDAQPSARSPGRLRTVQLEASSDRMLLVVGLDAAGATLAARTLETSAACADRAYAVAVMVAAWESELELESRPPRLPQPDPRPSSSGSDELLLAQAAAPATAVHRTVYGLGLGVLSSGRLLAPSALASVTFLGRGDTTGLRLSLGTQLPYDQPVGLGRAAWSRHAVGIGFAIQGPGDRFHLEFNGGIELALMTARGTSHSQNLSDTAFDKGLSLAVRGVLPMGTAVRPWIELGTTLWLSQKNLEVEGAYGTRAEVSLFEFAARLGVAFGG